MSLNGSASRADAAPECGERQSAPSRGLVGLINEQPLTYLGISATLGFFAGGGASSRAGLSMLAFVGRIVAREAALNFAAATLAGTYDRTRRDYQKRA